MPSSRKVERATYDSSVYRNIAAKRHSNHDTPAIFRQRFGTQMNRFMDMLEAREEGISAKAADASWDFCYEVTPLALHDVKRHKEWWDKTVNWEKFFGEE